MHALLFFAKHALLLLALAASAYIAGRLALRALLGDGARGAPGRFVLASALGLVVLATLGVLLGLAGLFHRTAVLGVLGAICLAGAPILREVVAARAGAAAALRTLGAPGAAIASVLGLTGFVHAVYPPTAFDETLYHLPYAQAFVASGGLPFLPELRFPIFPQLAEVLSAEMILFGGDVSTHLVSLFAVALTAALLWVWGDQWSSREGEEARPAARRVGALAAAIWLGNPIVTFLSGTGYVEPLLGLFVTAATFSFWRWRNERSPGSSRGWLALSGLFAGAAAGTKYLGLYFVAALAVSAFWVKPCAVPGALGTVESQASRRPTARRFGQLLIFGVAAMVAMAPWYGRILAATGNPVFPYLSGIFGRHDWTPVRLHDLYLPTQANEWIERLSDAARKLVTLPWDVVARRSRVGNQPPFSPAYLLALPLLVLAALRAVRRRAPRDRRSTGELPRLLLLSTGFVLLLPLLPPDARYLLPVLPLFSLGLAVALAELAPAPVSKRSRAVAAGFVILLLLPGWLYAGHRLVRQGPPPTSVAARERFLHRQLPFYPAVAFVNELVRPGDRVYGLYVEAMRYHLRGEVLGDWFGPHRYGLLEDLPDEPAALVARLASWKVDYLVVARDAPLASVLERGATGLDRLFEDSAARVYAVGAGDEGE